MNLLLTLLEIFRRTMVVGTLVRYRQIAGLSTQDDRSQCQTAQLNYRWGRQSSSHVLIEEDWVFIRVDSDEAGRPRSAFVRMLLQFHPLDL